MKIAIDARKWRDYGIGTYVRNLVRHLAHLDRETTYFLFCDRADEATLRDLAENFVPVVDDSARLQRPGALLDPAQAPAAWAPTSCTRRTTCCPCSAGSASVVTIHDCIHLLFPEYLPNRMALRYAQA